MVLCISNPFLPEASFGLRVLSLPASVRPSVRQSIHQSLRPSPILSARWGWLTMTFKVKFNFEVKIYPSLSLWVCPRHKSPRVVVRISKFRPTMNLSTVKRLINFGIDWASSSVSFSNLLFSTKLCVFYSFASVYIYLVRPSPVNAPHSTWHRTYTDSHTRGQGRTMDRDTV